MVHRYIGQAVAIRFFASLTLTIVVVTIIRTIIRELQPRLLDLAITAPLTGTFNRRHMASCLGDAVERHRRIGAPASVLLIDVDHFKRINDRFGHEAGDGVLKGIVALVTRRVRRLDRLFRMGGDEFVLFLPDTRGLDAATVAEELRGSVGGARPLNAAPVSVGIGVSGLQANQSAAPWGKQAADAPYPPQNDGRSRSRSENLELLRYSPSARSCASVTPAALPTAEPTSIEHGQPTREATLTAASVVSFASTLDARPKARSKPMYAAKTSGWCAVTAMGMGRRPTFFITLS